MIFLLPLLSVTLGYSIAFFLKKAGSVGFKLLLSFSGAYLLSVTIFELLPKVYQYGDNKKVGIFILFGLLLQIILEFATKGLEHGHFHHENTKRFPLLIFISLCVHAILEGFPLSESNHLLYGVSIHKIPVAAILTTFLFESKLSKVKIYSFLVLFGLMTPLGTFIENYIHLGLEYHILINCLVIGIFLHVSTTILFEVSKTHKFNASKLLVILLGIVIAYIL